MNISQIPTEYRFYPFFRGEYLGHVIEGYASVKSAQQRMKDSLIYELDELVYGVYFGSEGNYRFMNTIFVSYDVIKPYIDNNTIEINSNCPDLSITPEEYEYKLESLKNKSKIHCSDLNISYEQYNKLISQLDFRTYYIDERELKKARHDFIYNKVEYREGKLNVTVNWLDNNATEKF